MCILDLPPSPLLPCKNQLPRTQGDPLTPHNSYYFMMNNKSKPKFMGISKFGPHNTYYA